MSDRFFVFLLVENSWISKLLDLAIYALNPREKWPAHITLAGPYDSKLKVPRNLEFQQEVVAFGAGQFRSSKQNTVYLNVGTRDMWSVWNKPDYSFKPHMTIYDGPDHELGDAIFQELKTQRAFVSFYVTQLFVVRSGPQRDFELRSRIDLSVIPETASLTLDDFEDMSLRNRIEIAASSFRVLRSLADVQHQWW